MSHNGIAKPAQPKAVRCAIYTRKSTEEGLDQDFNSLDAQRECCEHYVASMEGEGWTCLPDRYDDGGFTGGNMDRPALKRLLAEIEDGKVDCVVIYKYDRLSRSMPDFFRMLEAFEKRGVAFVSVTQQFNTATSAGRLMLNMLLSFAQFERDLVSERTRDKIAAARRKGKWAGGRPVLGYDLISNPGGSKLLVNDSEARIVQSIFDLYIEKGSLMPVVEQCRRRGWTTKTWTTKAGKPQGGKTIDKGMVYAMLTNVVYLGKVRHHEHVYEGEHEAIVEPDMFERVQAQLRLNGKNGGSRTRNAHGALLKGLVRCKACDCGMVHHFASKKAAMGTKRYRYYVCMRAQKEGWSSCPAPSLPAGDLEVFVIEQIRAFVQNKDVAASVVERARNMLAESRVDDDELEGAIESFEPLWDALTLGEREELVHLLIDRIEYEAATESLSVSFHELAASDECPEEEPCLV